MKKNLSKAISVLFAVMLTAVTAVALFACNNRNDNDADAKLRADNVAALKDRLLNAADEKWSGEMDNADVAALKNAGDYVVAAGWADLICDVFEGSALQTGKLTSLKNYVLSEDGQKLLKDFEGNAELLIPLMRAVGFTPTDISNLTYDLLCALVSDSGNTVDAIISRLAELKKISGISVEAVENIEINGLNMAVIKTEFVPSAQEKDKLLKAFEAAKAPMSEIVEFAYNMSIGSITDNIFNALFSADGALSNISNGEIRTVIDTLIRNAARLKDKLGAGEIEKLNTAMGLIIDKFDKGYAPSALYAQVVQYAKYAYMFVDVIPAVCDVLSSAGKVFDDSLIEQLRNVASKELDEHTVNVNSAIITAKVVLAACNDFSYARLCELVDKLGAQVGGEYQKTLPLFALDMALYMSVWLKDVENTDLNGKHPELLGEEDVKVIVGAILMNFGLDKAKQAYRSYKNGECSFAVVISSVGGCGFDNFGIKNPYNPHLVAQADAWFNYYMVNGVAEANDKAIEVCDKAIRDIKQFLADFYAVDSESKSLVEKIANWQLVSENLSDKAYSEYEKQILNSDLVGIIGLISMLATK